MKQQNERKINRRRIIGLFFLLVFLCLTSIIFLLNYHQTSSVRLPDRYLGQIPQLHSSVDKDGDGIDDQTDILEGTLAYISTEPKYKSRYYSTGYPDDGYGVCTDVVAFAMRDAGYDLMEMVDEDIKAHPDEYNIESPDKNIDFRRVQNLKVWFKNNAVSLTTDLSDIEAWQGGDIVIFNNHIGVISDRRNKDGVPYVFHHNDLFQNSYEEDILEKRSDMVAHYRITE